MIRLYKITIFCGALAVILAIGHLALAGEGYFWETDNNNLYIFDRLYISGFLSVEQDLSARTGFPGDVLVEKYFYFDENKNVYFCKDERTPNTNAPQNKDCANKILVWTTDSLIVEDGKNQLITTRLNVPNNRLINLHAPADKVIQTKEEVKLNGCFSNLSLCNGGVNHGKKCNVDEITACPGGVCVPCVDNDFKTGTLYFDSLSPLSGDKLTVYGSMIKFEEINLGCFGGCVENYSNDNNHYVCWKTDKTATSCSLPGAAMGNKNTKWNFTVNLGTFNGGWSNSSGKLCCFLQFDF